MEGYFTVALTEVEKASLRKAYNIVNSLCQMAVGQNKIKVCGNFYTFDELIKMRSLCSAGKTMTTPVQSSSPSTAVEKPTFGTIYDKNWVYDASTGTYRFACENLKCDTDCPYREELTGLEDCAKLTEELTEAEMRKVRRQYEHTTD